MPTIVIDGPGQFSRAIMERLRKDTALVQAAALDACLGGVRDAVALTTKARAVDQGLFRSSWSASPVPRGAMLENTAPYAAVLEYGRRPNRPGPPLQPIIEWVGRKLRGEIRGQYRAARALALGLARGTAGSASFRRHAVRYTRSQFGSEANGVSAGVIARALAIRDAIHYRGTRPRRILGQTMAPLRKRFTVAVKRQLRRRP